MEQQSSPHKKGSEIQIQVNYKRIKNNFIGKKYPGPGNYKRKDCI